MQYSLPRDGRQGDMPRVLQDWICCLVRMMMSLQSSFENFNFSPFNSAVFKTSAVGRAVSSATNLDVTQKIPKGRTKLVNIRPTVSCPTESFFISVFSPPLTAAVLLRGLDALTTEDSVLGTLRDCTELPIKSLRIGRDSATNLSRGVCYVEMNSVSDAMFLHNRLLGEPPTIDDRLVGVSYYRSPQNAGGGGGGNAGPGGSSAASAAMAAAQWSHQGKEQQGGAMSDEEIEKMAKSAAEKYGKRVADFLAKHVNSNNPIINLTPHFP